jgi:glycosyltransferase involved in cell wall biosynthesis
MKNPPRILCVSHHAPPLNDAEALCTGRLLSVLARRGAEVHVIAADGPATLEGELAGEILDERVTVERVAARGTRLGRLGSMVRYGYHGPYVEWMGPAIEAARGYLRRHPGTVLMTRACPWVSNFIGWHCRGLAAAWVAHFSDPFPPHEWQNHWYSRFARPVNGRWARRILRGADLVTVTCPNAIRYIEEKSGVGFREKAMVVTHLAVPQIRAGGFRLERSADEFVIAHIGTLMMRRRPDLLLGGAMLAMEKHPAIRFLQYGHVDEHTLRVAASSSAFGRLDIRHIDNLSPRDAGDLQQQVDVNVIVDTDLGLPYSPFILSKYPHAACAGKPMLMISAADSEMARLTALEGGGEFVPFSTAEAVAEGICRLYEVRGKGEAGGGGNPYHRRFGPEEVVGPLWRWIEGAAERDVVD